MDFAFSAEQQQLREQVRRFVTERFPDDELVAVAEEVSTAEAKHDVLKRVRWSELVGLGWVGLSAPEDAGGSGMDFLDEAVVLEELGYGLYPGPYLSTVVALPALERDPGSLKRVIAGEMAATVSSHDLGSGPSGFTAAQADAGAWRLRGAKTLIPDLWESTFVVALADTDDGPAWFLIDVARTFEGQLQRPSTMDASRPLGSLETDGDGTEARMLSEPGVDTAKLTERLAARARAAAALEAVGVASRALELAIAYTKERRQFDKPIGAYQAVSHQVADTYMGVELARSLAYWAAWCVANSDDQAAAAAAAAKAAATEVAVAACERSIQVHGGVGFTWEHVLHRYYKRAQWLESFAGYPDEHRALVAQTILD